MIFANMSIKGPSDLVQYCPIRAVSDVLGVLGAFNYISAYPPSKLINYET